MTSGHGPSGMPTSPVATRKRKRAHQFTVSYSEAKEFDSDGRMREVIVIDDTPPPTISLSTTHNGAYSASYQPPMYSAPIKEPELEQQQKLKLYLPAPHPSSQLQI